MVRLALDGFLGQVSRLYGVVRQLERQQHEVGDGVEGRHSWRPSPPAGPRAHHRFPGRTRRYSVRPGIPDRIRSLALILEHSSVQYDGVAVFPEIETDFHLVCVFAAVRKDSLPYDSRSFVLAGSLFGIPRRRMPQG